MWKNSSKKKIVLVGGCFDILHPGHIIFLEKAKKAGDFLVVLLESDEKVKQLKGGDRPIHSQKDRTIILKALRFVDQVVKLPYMKDDQEYDQLIRKIKPDIIATTYGDQNIHHYQRSAKRVGAKLKFVVRFIKGHSTTRILDHNKYS